MNEKIKTCSECGRSLPLSEFNKNRNNKDGYQDRCRECFSKYNAARYAKTPHDTRLLREIVESYTLKKTLKQELRHVRKTPQGKMLTWR